MQKVKNKYLFNWQHLLFFVSVLLASLFSWAYYNYNHHSFNAIRFENALHQKSKQADAFAHNFTRKIKPNQEWLAVDSTETNKPQGVELLVYKNDSLCAWTSEVLPFENESMSLLSRRVAKLLNTWYIIKRIPHDEWDIFTLVSIKTEYPYNNDFLSDTYDVTLPLMICQEVNTDKNSEGFEMKDAEGNYLFTAQECDTLNPLYANWTVFFIFIAIILYLQLIVYTIKKKHTCINNNLVFLISVMISGGFYFIHVSYFFPNILFVTKLFSPLYFGASNFFPNMGSMLIFALLVFGESFVFYKYVKTPGFVQQLPSSQIKKIALVAISVVSAFLFWHIQNNIVTLLVSHSVSAPIFFKITDIQATDVVRLFIISLLWLAAVLVLEKTVKVFLPQLSKKQLTWIVVACMLLVTMFSFNVLYILSVIAFLVLTIMLIWVARRKHHHAYNTFIWFVFVFALYAIYTFYYHNMHNEQMERKLLIENLSFKLLQEEDPLTELLLKEVEDLIRTDSVVVHELGKINCNSEKLEKYIQKKYLLRYLKRYDLQVIPCWPGSDLKLSGDDNVYECYAYFNRLLAENGTQVMGSKHFYFLENQTGQVTYFGVFKINEGIPKKETCMYLELVSKPFFEGPGYPELLLSERESKLREPLVNYSYGKYVDGVLARQTGEFPYPIHLERITNVQNDFENYVLEDFSHMTFHPSENVCLVLSLPVVGPSMILVAFSIFFISFFIFGALLILSIRVRRERFMYIFSVQERIQIAFIGLMLALLIVIAGGSIWQTIHRFEIKNNQILSEKTRSVLLELEHKIGGEDAISPDMLEYLTDLLKKFSNIFYTDINLYDIQGRLLATSRPELFDRGLSGHLMNSRGFIELSQKGELEFIHRESIGELKYLSAYMPFYNENNKLLAYLNMPYFVGTSELREEISSLAMAIVNFYLIFLIVVIGLTVVISRRITHPLLVLQSKLSELKLGGSNEKIIYRGNDEIGQLVEQYNRMVNELSVSAEKLAKSERESAWREMARQIAHEIKNPLTPMKLSIQYLELSRKNKDVDFDEKLKKVSSTLIDQIDKLSTIASEFSSFATMPIAKRKKMNVIEALKQCVMLYDRSEEADVLINDNGVTEFFINADSEQMISVFNNLLQNAIQAIPTTRKGLINVAVERSEDNIIIKIQDNGKGVSPEAQEKLYVPNFTTKSSGMGLGLAIVKNIVTNTEGKIWFETQENVGTTFYVQFPAYIE